MVRTDNLRENIGMNLSFATVITSALILCSCSSQKEEQVPAARTSMTPAQVEREIFDRVNTYRRSRGLQVLVLSREMSELAREHSKSMASRGKMSHKGSGRRFSKMQRGAMGLSSFAENVALNFGHRNPAQTAVSGWIKSPGHHRNILRKEDRLTGIGVAVAKDGTWYFTQLFGRR